MCYAIPDEVGYSKDFCPVTEKTCYEEAVYILQNAMLGTKEDIDKFAEAIMNIQNTVNNE